MLNEQEKQLRDERLEQMTEDAFNANRFETAKSLLSELVDPKINKEAYYKLIQSYSYFDDVNYEGLVYSCSNFVFTYITAK